MNPLSKLLDRICPLRVRYRELYVQAKRQSDLYYELLFSVERKFPGETRHQTALRYIRYAELPTRGILFGSDPSPPSQYDISQVPRLEQTP
jgi:hypothetical protein